MSKIIWILLLLFLLLISFGYLLNSFGDDKENNINLGLNQEESLEDLTSDHLDEALDELDQVDFNLFES